MTDSKEERNAGEALDEQGRSELHVCAQNNWADESRKLIREGADVNCTDDQKRTPLHYCAQFGFPRIARILLIEAAGRVDINAVDAEGCTALHVCALTDRVSDVCGVLLEFHADTTIENNTGLTAENCARRQTASSLWSGWPMLPPRNAGACPGRHTSRRPTAAAAQPKKDEEVEVELPDFEDLSAPAPLPPSRPPPENEPGSGETEQGSLF